MARRLFRRKDSTLLAHLVVECILNIAPDERHRRVFICSNDTLVESPVLQAFVDKVLARMAEGLAALAIPVEVVKTAPLPEDITGFVGLQAVPAVSTN